MAERRHLPVVQAAKAADVEAPLGGPLAVLVGLTVGFAAWLPLALLALRLAPWTGAQGPLLVATALSAVAAVAFVERGAERVDSRVRWSVAALAPLVPWLLAAAAGSLSPWIVALAAAVALVAAGLAGVGAYALVRRAVARSKARARFSS